MFKTFLKNHSFSKYRFKSDIFPTVSDRNFWDAFPNDTCVNEAERELGYAWPIVKATDFMEFKKSGNRKIMENIHFDRRNHLVLFALAELKENKGRFLPQITNGLFTICEESFWGLSAHWVHGAKNIPTPAEPYIDLFAAETAEQVVMVLSLLRAPLTEFCPEIIDRIEYELDVRIKQPYLIHFGYWWMGYGKAIPNNWNPWILSNVLTVFLLSERNNSKFHRALVKMFEEIQHYYDALPNDGGCDEGPGYWERAGASLFEFVYQLKQATDGSLDLFDDEKLRRIAAYMKKIHVVSDKFANVADAHASGKSTSMLLLYGYAKETGQVDLMNFSAAVFREKGSKQSSCSHAHRTMRRLIYHSEFLREIESFEVSYPLHPILEYMPDMHFATLRRGDMCLSVKGGHNNESHNHNDVGSFTLYDGETPVLIDVGINAYTRFTFSDKRYEIPWVRSLNHNLPIINGVEQKNGINFCADSFKATEEAVDISFAKAYPETAGIKTLSRRLTLDENGVVFTDSFDFKDNTDKNVTQVLVTALDVTVEDNCAILANKYIISADEGVVSTDYLPFDDAGLERDWNAKGITRILICANDVSSILVKIERVKK